MTALYSPKFPRVLLSFVFQGASDRMTGIRSVSVGSGVQIAILKASELSASSVELQFARLTPSSNEDARFAAHWTMLKCGW